MKKQIFALIAVSGLSACSSVPDDPWVLVPKDMEFLIRHESAPVANANSGPVSVEDMLSKARLYAQAQHNSKTPKKSETK
ncbi:MAG: hypothetical protein KTR23_01830 [Rhodospirillales bacterium]|nr:hypothetical protein [Rhodospirillales bacterium]